MNLTIFKKQLFQFNRLPFSTLHASNNNLKTLQKINKLQKQTEWDDRSDTLKYSYLDNQPPFETIIDRLHPDLTLGLKANNYTYMTEVQSLAIDAGLLDNKNLVLNSETGSGKTLAYLLPVMNQLFHFKDSQNIKPKGARFHMTKQNEEQMFLSAEEIMNKDQRMNKRLFFNRTSDSQLKGAIILSYSKELLNQIYVQARRLDLNDRLLINRATSSLQMKTPIVEFITPDKEKQDSHMDEDQQFEISLKNVINNASWKLTDVLLATPIVMSHILDNKEKYDPYDINPAVIIVDEFDELLSNPGLSQHIIKILRKFANFSNDRTNPMAHINKQRQFIFAGATIPKTILSGHDAMATLQDWFPGIEQIRTDSCHKVSHLIQYEWINLENILNSKYNTALTLDLTKAQEEAELNLLVETVRRSLDILRSKSIMIFADSKKQVDKVCEVLKKAEIKNLPYYQDIGVFHRQTTLQMFMKGDLPVLVCTNLAARGLDTINVDHVIQFDFAKNVVDYIHRVGRTGRMGQRGNVTNFIRKGDYDLEQKIREYFDKKQAFDKLISKKRSFRKNIKRAEKNLSQGSDDYNSEDE